MSSIRPHCLLAVILALAGCGTSPLHDPDVRAERGPSMAPGPGVKRAAPVVEGPLHLRDALALGLAHSPQLAAFSWDMRAAEARLVQAGLWSNPELMLEFEDFAGSGELAGVRSLETTLSLAQTVPLGGDIARSSALAAQQAQLAGWDYEVARVALLTQITQRFVDVVAAQHRVAIARDGLRLAQEVRATTQKRIASGDAAEIELARVSVPVALAQVALRRAEHVLESARHQLALSWGQSLQSASGATFTEAVGGLEQLSPVPPAAALVNLINENAQVAQWATRVRAHQAELALLRAQATPDVTAGLGVRHANESDDVSLVAGLSLPLPLFDRQQGAIGATQASLEASRQRQRQAELDLEATLSEQHADLAAAHDEAGALRDLALPQAREAFAITTRAFERGDLGLLDMLDAERTLVELEAQYVEALRCYHRAAAAIEGLVGRPISSLGHPDAAAPRSGKEGAP